MASEFATFRHTIYISLHTVLSAQWVSNVCGLWNWYILIRKTVGRGRDSEFSSNTTELNSEACGITDVLHGLHQLWMALQDVMKIPDTSIMQLQKMHWGHVTHATYWGLWTNMWVLNSECFFSLRDGGRLAYSSPYMQEYTLTIAGCKVWWKEWVLKWLEHAHTHSNIFIEFTSTLLFENVS